MNSKLNKGRLWLAGVALMGATLGGCDFLDPTNVENPRTTAEDLADAENPTAALLPGLRAQFARALGATVVISGVVSDNYSIHGTGIFKEYDDPRAVTSQVANTESRFTGPYWNLQELRALASFVLDISAEDATATADDIAEVRYYRGMAALMLAENFQAAPIEEDGAALDGTALLQAAVGDLQAAASSAVSTQANAALARAYRWLGDASSATTAAVAALGADPAFVFQQEYDAGTLDNAPHAYLVTRALQEMQPLPRLDFLDPKFLTREAGIAFAKAEEMHLIMAEAQMAAGNFAQGRDHLVNAIMAADSRGETSYTDNDQRLNADLSIRPRNASIMIAAAPGAPLRAGLVLDRPDVSVMVPEVTGTSLDADSVSMIPVSNEDDLWHALHLARQEMMILEGRRMADLGIRLPMMQREIDQNPNISAGGPGTVPIVPSYIPNGEDMDFFTPASPYDADGNLLVTEVTINVDMNEVLTQNRVTPF